MFDQVRRMKKRQLAFKALHIAMIVSTAVMAWKGLKCLTGCERPLFVEISGSMEPAFDRGDLLFLTDKKEEPIRVGEIVVFKVEGLRNLIVHRVIKLHESEDGSVKFLTKGDSNGVDDRNLYADGQFFVERKDVIGRVRGFVPYLGKVTIMLDRYTYLKYAFLVVLGLVNCEYRRLAIAVASCLLAGDLFY